jgi:hypothetical protein
VVHFTSNDAAATLPPNSTLAKGQKTFNAALKTAGSRSITATDSNHGVVNGTSNTITVSKATPELASKASGSVPLGGAISDNATLSTGVNPIGTMTFALFGPNNGTCGGTPIFSSSKGVNGNGSYTSASFVPTATGTYRWVASYSGDPNNNHVAGVCNAANESVTVTTPPPTPTPTPTPAARALNISTRLRVEAGDNVMIGGFIITGNASKPVLLRGMGPSLAKAGIPAATILHDPVLELHGPNGSLIMRNDNWKDSPQRSQIEGTIFAPSDDRESVIVATLPPASYTAVLTGKNKTTGIGLIEIYDNKEAVDSQLANISTRGFIDAGDSVMIGGFTLGGSSSNARVAIRGIGPSLASAGLSHVLADPTLALHNANGTLLTSNDNWKDDPTSAAQLTARGLGLHDVHESGIFISLPPGQFTAILAGKNGATGIGLIEIYNLE